MKWINIKDKKPSPSRYNDKINEYGISDNFLGLSEEDAVVMCFISGSGNIVEYIYSEGRCGELEEGKKITHWMPLPEGEIK